MSLELKKGQLLKKFLKSRGQKLKKAKFVIFGLAKANLATLPLIGFEPRVFRCSVKHCNQALPSLILSIGTGFRVLSPEELKKEQAGLDAEKEGFDLIIECSGRAN